MRLRSSASRDPAVERELAAIDAALSGESVPDDLRDLEALVRDARTIRPAPAERFAQELDRRVVAGFAEPKEPGQAPRRVRGLVRGRMLMPALGATASV